MSDELDDELRAQSWRRWAPDITDGEIDVLDRLYGRDGKAVHRYGPALVLAAYRLGAAVQAPAGPNLVESARRGHTLRRITKGPDGKTDVYGPEEPCPICGPPRALDGERVGAHESTVSRWAKPPRGVAPTEEVG